jgi:glycosyltransferase involved in cell wall biosynthesis
LLLLDKKYVLKYVEFNQRGGFRYSDRQMAKLYQGAVATLCLAVNEPFGLAAIESMACGTPVIAIDEGGYAETIVRRRTGLLIKRDPIELAKSMKRMQDMDFRNRLGENGREMVLKNFGWDGHIKKLEAIMRRIKT